MQNFEFLYTLACVLCGMTVCWLLMQENPFKQRICEVFSDAGDGQLSFDNFLDLFSVFSEGVSTTKQTHYVIMCLCYTFSRIVTNTNMCHKLLFLHSMFMLSHQRSDVAFFGSHLLALQCSSTFPRISSIQNSSGPSSSFI